MTILQKYVLKHFIRCYFLCLGGLISVFLIVDFFERVDEFLKRDAPILQILQYYFLKIPFVTFFMGPQAVMLATVIALATLARNNEFTAMKACGIGVTGITMPIIGCSVAIALLILANHQFVTPFTTTKMNYIFSVEVRGKKTYHKIPQENIWFRSSSGTIWNIKRYKPKKNLLRNVSLFFTENNQIIEKRIDAEEAEWTGKEWLFKAGYLRTFNEQGLLISEPFEERTFKTKLKPKDLNKYRVKPDELSLTEMYKDIEDHAAQGKDMTQKRVDMHHKISYPFISIVLALLAIPLSLRSSRHGGVLFCVWVNLLVGFGFSFFYAMGVSLGHGGVLGPLLAAWGPNILFTAVGFYLILTLDSEKILPI